METWRGARAPLSWYVTNQLTGNSNMLRQRHCWVPCTHRIETRRCAPPTRSGTRYTRRFARISINSSVQKPWCPCFSSFLGFFWIQSGWSETWISNPDFHRSSLLVTSSSRYQDFQNHSASRNWEAWRYGDSNDSDWKKESLRKNSRRRWKSNQTQNILSRFPPSKKQHFEIIC